MRLKRGVQKYTEEENKVAEQKEVLTIHKKWKKKQKKSPQLVGSRKTFCRVYKHTFA